MKKAIQDIETALLNLNALEFPLKAEDFLTDTEWPFQKAATQTLDGALYIHQPDEDLQLGIYLSSDVRKALENYPTWRENEWNAHQLHFFSVAIEELSHFFYVVYHSRSGRQLTQLELELQGEIDKFLVLYFSKATATFENLFETVFENFRLASKLSLEQQNRYQNANRLAKRFISKLRKYLTEPLQRQNALDRIRKFYRLGLADKVSQIMAT